MENAQKTTKQSILGKIKTLSRHIVFAMGLLAAVSAPQGAQAANTSQQVMVVGNDWGGPLRDRMVSLQALKQQGTRVEIRGNICASSCTMYLGLPNACVMPNTRFGFHGPSNRGRPLPQADYERWSMVVAAQYPLVLRDWFMTDARKNLVKMQFISGQTLIGLGLKQC